MKKTMKKCDKCDKEFKASELVERPEYPNILGDNYKIYVCWKCDNKLENKHLVDLAIYEGESLDGIRDLKGRFIGGHEAITSRDKSTGRFVNADNTNTDGSSSVTIGTPSLENKVDKELDRLKRLKEC